MNKENVIIGLLVAGGIYLLYKSTLNVTAAAATNAVNANVTGASLGLAADGTALINGLIGNFSQAN
jgi:hypothetical protein